jgi:hypothetical protein
VGIVDGAVALVRNHKVSMRAQSRWHRVGRQSYRVFHDDLAFKASFATVEQLCRIVTQIVVKSFLSLLCELYPVS